MEIYVLKYLGQGLYETNKGTLHSDEIPFSSWYRFICLNPTTMTLD